MVDGEDLITSSLHTFRTMLGLITLALFGVNTSLVAIKPGWIPGCRGKLLKGKTAISLENEAALRSSDRRKILIALGFIVLQDEFEYGNTLQTPRASRNASPLHFREKLTWVV